MNIKLYLILALLGSTSFCYSMEQALKKANTDVEEEMVMILPCDAEEAIEVPLHLAKLSKTLERLMEDVAVDEPIPLSAVSFTVWEAIQALLERLYAIKQGTELPEALADCLRDSDVPHLELLKAINYLEIPGLFNMLLKCARLWDITCKELKSLPLDLKRALIVRFLLQYLGRFYASEIQWQKANHTSEVYAAGETQFITVENHCNVILWNLIHGKPIATYTCEDNPEAPEQDSTTIRSVSLTENKLICGTENGIIRVWDMQTERPIARYVSEEYDPDSEYNASAFYTALMVDGKIIGSTAGDDKTGEAGIFYIWDAKTCNQLFKFEGLAFFANNLCIVDDKIVCILRNKRTVGVWDLNGIKIAEFSPVQRRLLGQNRAADLNKSVAHSIHAAENNTFIIGCLDGAIEIWDLTLGKKTAIIPSPGSSFIQVVCVTNGTILARNETLIYLFDVATCKLIAQCAAVDGEYFPCLVGNTVVAYNDDTGNLHSWDLSTLGKLRTVSSLHIDDICDYLEPRTPQEQSDPSNDNKAARSGWQPKATWRGIAEILDSKKESPG